MKHAGAPDPLYVKARKVPLDALDALGPHRASAVIVGAQAVYLTSGRAVGHVCDGLDGWKKTRSVCPWCSISDRQSRPCITSLVFGGYCGSEFICGQCGFRWNPSEGVDLRPVKLWTGDYRTPKRERNRAFAQSVLRENHQSKSRRSRIPKATIARSRQTCHSRRAT